MKGLVTIENLGTNKYGKDLGTKITFRLNFGLDDVHVEVFANEGKDSINSQIAKHGIHVIDVDEILAKAEEVAAGNSVTIDCEYIHGIGSPEHVVDCDM